MKQKKQSLKEISIQPPKGFSEEKYSFCEGFNFLYSSLDHTFIPGLVRPWNTGFLTPVFFNIDVLNKYSQNPAYSLELFSSTYGTIRKGEDWNVQFGVNSNKKIILWLGDIDKLPEKEKHYLLSENVKSDHDIHSEFYNAQIDIEWAPTSVESRVFQLRKDISELIQKSHGIPLNMLDGEISKVIENLDKPIFWEEKHVSPVIEALNRVFVESINLKGVKQIIKKANPNLDLGSKGSLKVVTEWFGDVMKMPNTPTAMCPLYVLYDLRIMVCHLQSDQSKELQLEKINERLGLPPSNESYESIYNELFNLLELSLTTIHKFLESSVTEKPEKNA